MAIAGKKTGVVKTQRVLGMESWHLVSSTVEAFLTKTGGHLAPVRFKLGKTVIEPYAIAPWHSEKVDRSTPTILRVMRGDFFCMPFGGNAKAWEGEQHPVHGQTANDPWTLVSLEHEKKATLGHFRMKTKIRPAVVDKEILLRDGQTVVYQRHTIRGGCGPMPMGHHPILSFPEEHGSGIISTSKFVFGQVFPGMFEFPDTGGYQALQPGSEFKSLKKVPTATGSTTDLTHYPARRGFEDLVMMVADKRLPFAWTAVTFARQGYVWFAIRDPKVLRNTILWISNGGRHYAPWNGRHHCAMGIEDVTACFHMGLTESAGKNALTQRGYPTSLMLTPESPTVINYISGVVAIPHGFDHVQTIEASDDQQTLTLTSASGKSVRTSVDVAFLKGASA